MTEYSTEQILNRMQTLRAEGRTGDARQLSKLTGVSLPPENYAAGLARSAGQGLLFGGGDEAAAGARALYGSLFGSGDMPIGQRYDKALADERARIESFGETNPISSGVAEFAGAVPTGLAGGGLRLGRFLASKAAPLSRKVAASAGLGGAQSGVYGFGAGEGGATNRADNALSQAALGATIGGALPLAGSAVRGGLDAVAARRAASAENVNPKVFPVVTEAMRDIPQAEITKTLKEAGPQAMVADVVDPRVLDRTVQVSPAAARVAQKNITERVNVDKATLDKTLNETFGAFKGGERAVARKIAEQTAPQRDKAYKKAYAQPINYANESGKEVQNVFNTVPANILRKATTEANEEMLIDGVGKNQILLKEVGGKVEISKLPNMVQADYLKRGLDNVAEKATDQFGRPLPQGRRARKLSGRLRDALRENVPVYGIALRAGADKIQRDRASQLGKDIFKNKVTLEDVTDLVEKIKRGDVADIALNDFQQGIRRAIKDKTSQIMPTMADPNTEIAEAKKLVKQLRTTASREKLTAVLGKPKADKLFRDINRLAKSFYVQGGIARNSATYGRQATENMNRQLNAPGVMQNLRMMRPLEAARRAGQSLMQATPESVFKRSDAMNESLAQLLTGPRGGAAQDAALRAATIVSPQRQAMTQGQDRLLNQLLFPTVAPASSLEVQEIMPPGLFGNRQQIQR